jgi:hypothetical protein
MSKGNALWGSMLVFVSHKATKVTEGMVVFWAGFVSLVSIVRTIVSIVVRKKEDYVKTR